MLQIIAGTILSFAMSFTGPLHHAAYHSESLLSQSGVQRYYIPDFSGNFVKAATVCFENYGKDYGLADIRDQQSLKDLVAFLGPNAAVGTEYWIDGAYDEAQKKYYWTQLKNPDGSLVYFKDFVMKLFKTTDVPQPTFMSRTRIYMQDRLQAKIVPRNWIQPSKFVCESRQKR